MAKHQGRLIIRVEVITVRLGDIQQQDSFTQQLLGPQDFKTDHAGSPDIWAFDVLEIAALTSLPVLVERVSGFHYLGSGLKIHLMQQFYGPEAEIYALLYKPKSVSAEFKMNVLASEVLHAPGIYRTTRFRPRQNMALWEAIVQAGGVPIHGEGPRVFSAATGYSYNSLVPPEKNKSLKPVLISPTQEEIAAEVGEASLGL